MTFCSFINHLFIWWTDIRFIKYPFLDWYKNRQRNLVSDLKGLPLIPQLHLLFANSFVLTWVLSHSFAGFFLLVHSLKQTKRKTPGLFWCCPCTLLCFHPENLLITAGDPSMYTSPTYSSAANLRSVPVLRGSVLGTRSTVTTQALLSQSSRLPMRQTGKT